tara:strand:- start:414 stop:1364 length:951 start_codon:yes stop_codon:yes gene_type:complete
MKLAVQERARFAALEEVVEKNLTGFIAIGDALREIKESGLFRDRFETWEEYLSGRWGHAFSSRQQAARLMAASSVVENVQPTDEQRAQLKETHVRHLAKLEPEAQREAFDKALDASTDGKLTEKLVKGVVLEHSELVPESVRMKPKRGPVEWYTPEDIVDRAADVMDGIEIDPASCKDANIIVQAEKFYTAETNGLAQEWIGSVWLNPPYDLVSPWADKLSEEIEAGRVTEACVLVNASTETKWFSKFAARASSVCFIAGRLSFWNPTRESKNAPHGNALFYFGSNASKFYEEFAELGLVFNCNAEHFTLVFGDAA